MLTVLTLLIPVETFHVIVTKIAVGIDRTAGVDGKLGILPPSVLATRKKHGSRKRFFIPYKKDLDC